MHHHQNHPQTKCPWSCWTCGLLFKTDTSLKTHNKTVKHLLKAREFQIFEEPQQTDQTFKNMNEQVRYHSYIQRINPEALPEDPSYQYSNLPLTNYSTTIPLEPLDPRNPPTDPRIPTAKPTEASEAESLEVMKFLEDFIEFDNSMEYKNPTTFPAQIQDKNRETDQTEDLWMIIDETGNTENPAILIPPSEFDFLDLVEL